MLSNLAVRDIETLVHPYTNLAAFRETGPLVIERGRGSLVYDNRGKAYIEGMAGLWCTALGYGNEELAETAAAQMRKLSFGHLFTGLPTTHADFDLPLAGCLHTAWPHHYRFAAEGESEAAFASRLALELDELIEREGPDTVAAFIAEPVMGAGGVIVPPESYFEKVMEVCRKYDVYMIADEVICGFGRLGTWFGCQALGLRPNARSVAKALTPG